MVQNSKCTKWLVYNEKFVSRSCAPANPFPPSREATNVAIFCLSLQIYYIQLTRKCVYVSIGLYIYFPPSFSSLLFIQMVTCHISPLHCFFPKQQSLQILLDIKSFLILVMISFDIISNLQKSCRKSIGNFHISFTQIPQLSAFWPHLLYNSLSMCINIYPHTFTHLFSDTSLYTHIHTRTHFFSDPFESVLETLCPFVV